jgi:hypothetical protein
MKTFVLVFSNDTLSQCPERIESEQFNWSSFFMIGLFLIKSVSVQNEKFKTLSMEVLEYGGFEFNS